MRQARDKAERQPAADEQNRHRQTRQRGNDEHAAERGEEREQTDLVVGGEVHRPRR